jgi:putative DNA primase/helicase
MMNVMTIWSAVVKAYKMEFHLFPLRVKDKRPATTEGFKDATRDKAIIKAWWAENPEYNIGIACGESGIAVVDCDKGLADRAAFDAWFAESGLPPTYAVHTGRRTSFGVQLYYRGTMKSSGAGKFELNGVTGEVKSIGGYVVGVGSIHPDSGEEYEFLADLPLADLPPIVSEHVHHKKEVIEQVAESDGLIPQGDWHNLLVSHAGTLMNLGIRSPKGLYRGLLTYALEKFDVSQGLDKAHVMEIAASAAASFESETKEEAIADLEKCKETFAIEEVKEAAASERPADEPICAFNLTETGNAERFAYRYKGAFIFTKARDWMVYRNGIWWVDKTGQVDRALLETLRHVAMEADGLDEKIVIAFEAFAKKSESANGRAAALRLSAKERAFARNYDAFDRHEDLICCKNGVMNLTTQEFGPHKPEYLFTKGTDITYEAGARCPQFEAFVSQVMDGNANLIGYLQRWCGYSLSASTEECAMCVPVGIAGSGKSTLLNVLTGILGDYGAIADAEMFMAKRGDSGQPFEFAGLEGKRGLIAVETEEGKSFAVAKIKRMSGNDTIRACYKHKDWFEFQPSWKIWLACNDFPVTPAGDQAIWDRLKPVPFRVRFRGQQNEIKDLSAKLLREEGSGILNWMLRGYGEWKRIGLAEPAEAREAQAVIREEMDFLARFLEEKTERTELPHEYVSNKALFNSFVLWAEANKEGRGWDQKRFTKECRSRGLETKPTLMAGRKTVRAWQGIRLLEYTPPTALEHEEAM